MTGQCSFAGLEKSLPARLTGAGVEDLTVWVDPLDATKEYTEGHLDHVTVLIGIAFGDEAVAGVIHQPFYGLDMPFFAKITKP